ncbi:10783_t:CDS:2 [Funneliformis geosporum]|uniref:10783_t:CDS:1 n=1 Tax=Funneliformis geosporum TaxID=1117311 RepID=A0A9W4WSR8_9GLOM|nr:10783_t:CDS:2 [Funneliformis geosporum]
MSGLKNEVDKFCERLRLPVYSGYTIDTDISRIANAFYIQAEPTFEELQKLIKTTSDSDNKLDDDDLMQIIVTCANFIGEELWTNPNLNKNAIATIELLITIQPDRFPTVTHMIQTFVPKILEKYVKPTFMKYPVNVDKRRNGKSKRKTVDFDSANESWRGEVAQCSNLLLWCILHLKNSEIEKTIGLIIPPTLSLIDDYNVDFKTRGVSILDHLLKKLKQDTIHQTGLGDVFHEALSKCLTYQSETSHVSLLRQSFSAIISLISLTEKTNSETRYIKYEQILSNNVVKGFIFSGDKIVIRIILLQQIPKLAEELGIVTVKYIQELIHVICDSLEFPFEFTNKEQMLELHLEAAKGIEKIIGVCWPSLQQLHGIN